MALTLCIGVVSNTYSKYVANATGNIDVMFASWQILLNTTDITENKSSTINFTPVIDEKENIAKNVIAPSSTGYFDIEIDPSNVEVSFKYTIELAVENSNLPDIKMKEYAIVPNDYVEGQTNLQFVELKESQITNTLIFDKTKEGFKFEPITIRVRFEWIEGTDEQMDDEADTNAAIENEELNISANINFEQVI